MQFDQILQGQPLTAFFSSCVRWSSRPADASMWFSFCRIWRISALFLSWNHHHHHLSLSSPIIHVMSDIIIIVCASHIIPCCCCYLHHRHHCHCPHLHHYHPRHVWHCHYHLCLAHHPVLLLLSTSSSPLSLFSSAWRYIFIHAIMLPPD